MEDVNWEIVNQYIWYAVFFLSSFFLLFFLIKKKYIKAVRFLAILLIAAGYYAKVHG